MKAFHLLQRRDDHRNAYIIIFEFNDIHVYIFENDQFIYIVFTFFMFEILYFIF